MWIDTKPLIIYVSLIIILICALGFCVKKLYYSPIVVPQGIVKYDRVWDSVRTSVYNTLPIDSSNIVFVGNGFIEGFPVTEYYGEKVKNRGIEGNTTSMVLKRINVIAIQKPWKIFLEVGIDDILLGYSVDSTFSNYKNIIDSIHIYSPGTKVFMQAILPTSMALLKLNTQIQALNTKIEALRNGKDLFFMDLYRGFEEDNMLPDRYTYDGLHLNGSGYVKWRDMIDIYIYSGW